MPIANRIAEMKAEVATWRHDIHEYPEILFDVHRTAASVEVPPAASVIAITYRPADAV